jgi:hypothetical protein
MSGPPCAGSFHYGPHSARIPRAYTIITPAGSVFYCCDLNCLRLELDRREEEARALDRIGGLPLAMRKRSAR